MGTHGSITVARRAGDITGSHVARCRFRDFDGRTRLTRWTPGRSVSGLICASPQDPAVASVVYTPAGGTAVSLS
jgi:hypothetical protein